MRTRYQIQAARRLALAAAVLLRGRARMAAWTLHEILRLGPTLLRNSDLNGPVAHRFRTSGNEVWLTIDDGPDPEQTPMLLDLLAAADARASFFVIGRQVDWNRPLCRRIVGAGHTLENHKFTLKIKKTKSFFFVFFRTFLGHALLCDPGRNRALQPFHSCGSRR